jgi:hypothetical protein
VYALWLLLAEQWASALGVPAEKLEMIMFTDGLPHGSSWRPAEPTAAARITSDNSLTCADAIARVLERTEHGLRAADIVREINHQTLYRRQDGRPLPAYQVSSIADANPSRFQILGGVISLNSATTVVAGPRSAPSTSGVSPACRIDYASAGPRVILLGCVKEKLDHPAPAKDLYCSRLWNARRAYAEASELPWLILSAEHGVLDPDQELAPYDVALRSLSVSERRSWGERVVHALARRFASLDGMSFEVHAGEAYRTSIEPGLRTRGAWVEAPLAGLTIGRHLDCYRTHGRARAARQLARAARR